MTSQSAAIRTIKRRPKLDAQAIALIVHYIVQIERTMPNKGITWTELEIRFNYSRQALDKHEPIRTAYRNANLAANRHLNKESTTHEIDAPKSWTEQQRLLAKLRDRVREKDEINKKLHQFVVDLAQKCREKGVTIADIQLNLPAEYRDPIFSTPPSREKIA